MNLGDLRTNFQSLLNRSDCTDDQATIFLTQGMQRVQREIRIPSQERLVVYNEPTSLTSIPVPADLIQPIDIMVMSDGLAPGYAQGDLVALSAMPFRQLQRVSTNCWPRAYGRYQAAYYIRGTVPANLEVHLYYYGEFSDLADDTSENEIMAAAPDLCTYAALALAGPYFQHDNSDTWEAQYRFFRDAVADQAAAADSNGGPMQVASAYGDYI